MTPTPGQTQTVDTFKDLPLWQRFTDEAPVRAVANVEQLLLDAGAMLDRIVETFPTYTLHNSTHATNVVRLMGDLLGSDGLRTTTPLEAAMLLLSAYFHDIGMLFSKSEIGKLTKQAEWDEFLERNPEAFIVVNKARSVPTDIVEWYCRSLHASRVFRYLDHFPGELLKWGAVSVKMDLGRLCESHNASAKDLLNLEVDYLGECDLRLCAILLRLADILDFDGSRSPEMVYKFLELQKRKSRRDAHSDTEWRKHLASNGFKFPDTRTPGFGVKIVAGPDEPAVEHDLRRFLEAIEEEFQACRAVLTTCNERWRKLCLPGSVDRHAIKSNGYRYGGYRFSLQHDEILNLLMGENLYEDPYVFVRELLQNAIDTSRHREFLERASGNNAFRAAPVSVSEWEDPEGRKWVRFDDYGAGMNEQIVQAFLLKVGRSYYASPQFKAELIKLGKKTSHEFMPISRFGIGLLSCFLVGDRVEIFSIRKRSDGKRDEPVRLSLNGLHGFYTFQTPPLAMNVMPSAKGDEVPNLNRDFGTSVAVRLDPKKEQAVFDLRSEVERHIRCSPVRVTFEGELIGGNSQIIEKPGIRRHRVIVDKQKIRDFEEQLGHKFKEPFMVEFEPLDLTKHSPTTNLRGQLVVARCIPPKEWKKLARIPKTLELTCKIDCHEGQVSLKLIAQVADYSDCKDITIRKIPDRVIKRSDSKTRPSVHAWINITDLAERVSPCRGLLGQNPKWLVHNGIVTPTRVPDRGSEDLDWGDRLLWFRSASLLAAEGMWGIVCLSDSLRPNVSVSRDVLVNLPVHVHSAIALAIFRAKGGVDYDYSAEPLNHFTGPDGILLGSLLSDPLVTSKTGWQSEVLFETDRGRMNLRGIQSTITKGQSLSLSGLHSPKRLADSEFSGFTDAVTAALAQIGLRIELETGLFREQFIAVPGPPLPIEAGHRLFPPLTFLPFKNSKDVIRSGILNISHPLPKWLLKAAPKLHEKYPGILKSIRHAITANSLQDVKRHLRRLLSLHADVRPPKSLFS